METSRTNKPNFSLWSRNSALTTIRQANAQLLPSSVDSSEVLLYEKVSERRRRRRLSSKKGLKRILEELSQKEVPVVKTICINLRVILDQAVHV